MITARDDKAFVMEAKRTQDAYRKLHGAAPPTAAPTSSPVAASAADDDGADSVALGRDAMTEIGSASVCCSW